MRLRGLLDRIQSNRRNRSGGHPIFSLKPTVLRQFQKGLPLGVAVVGLLILNGTSGWVYRTGSEQIRDNFRRNLESTARILAHRVENAYWEELDRRQTEWETLDTLFDSATDRLAAGTRTSEIDSAGDPVVPFETWLRQSGPDVLRDFWPGAANAFQDLYLLDRTGALVGTLNGDLIPNALAPSSSADRIHPALVQDDGPAIRSGLETGSPALTPEVVRGDLYYLTAYVPLSLDLQTEGLVGVRANLLFGDRLALIRRRLLFLDGAGSLMVALLAWMFYRVSVGLSEAESKLRHRERLAQLGEMTSVVAHEVRNPLGIIEQTAEVLRRRYAQEKPDPMLDYISEEVDRLNRIVSRFLEFSRPEKDPTSLAGVECDLAATAAKAVERLGPAAMEKGVLLEGRCAESLSPVRGLSGDAAQQILLNLILNAIDASREGQKVRVAVESDRSGVLLRVEDEGIGMDPEHLAKAGNPFFTTKEKGSGLGLSLVEKLVFESGGNLRIDSRPSQGTSISITFKSSA